VRKFSAHQLQTIRSAPHEPVTVKWWPNSGWTARGRETAESAAAGGGNRAANNALWVIANVRLGSDPRTKEFLAKRTATGNSRKEIMRMLQRYIARELYPLIIDALRPALPGD
jgi:hypothetical protein